MKRGAGRRRLSYEKFVNSERAHFRHWSLEKAVVDLCSASEVTVLTNKHIDLLADCGRASVIFEVKSCTLKQVGKKVRQAIYQLLEYRFLYRDELASDVRLCVVAERPPNGSVHWLLGYMEHLGIGIMWKDQASGQLICSAFTERLLADVLPQIVWSHSQPI